MQLHPIFHISLLELVLEGTQIDKPHLHIEVHEEAFKVEAILDKQRINNKDRYEVKWKEYGNKHNTWEPVRNLKDA